MSDWVPPERALDNLPAEIGPAEPVSLDRDRDVRAPIHRLYEIRPIGAGAARLSVEIDLEAAEREAGLRLDPQRPLLGFHRRRQAGGLAPEILLERADPGETALLALDLDAVLDFDAERFARGGDRAEIVAPFILAQTDRLRASPIRRAHRLRLELAREDWLTSNFALRLRFGPNDAQRDVLYPAAHLGDAPDAEQPLQLAEIRVERQEGVDAPPRTARPLTAALDARITLDEGAEPGADAELGLGRHILKIDPPTLSLPASGRVAHSSHRVWLRCGPRALREPEDEIDLVLHVRMDLGEGRLGAERYPRWSRSFRLKPDPEPATLVASIQVPDAAAKPPPGADRTVVFAAGEPREERIELEPVTLRAVSAGVAPSVALAAIDLALSGRAPADQEVVALAQARIVDLERREIAGVLPEIRIEPEARRFDLPEPEREPGADAPPTAPTVGAVLASGARRARLVAAIEQSERAFEAALQDLYEPGQRFLLELDLEAQGLTEGVVRITRPFQFEAIRDRRVLAVDFGGSAIAAALSDASGAPQLARLGPAMAAIDPGGDETDGFFLESALDLSPEAVWRARLAPETLWRAATDAGLRVDPVDAARGLDRAYALALPPLSPFAPGGADARQRAALGARLSMGAVKMAGDGARLPLERPVWARDAEPDLTASADPERVMADALHEFADFHLAAAGLGPDAFGARVVISHPTRYGPRQKARLRRAAEPMLRRLGLDPAARAPGDLTLISEAEAALAHHLNRLPPDGRPTVTAALYDLGAATLDLAIASAERIDPEHGARVHGARLEAVGGAEIGGDAIDLVLYFIIAEALRTLGTDRPEARLRIDPLEPAQTRRGPVEPDASAPDAAPEAAERLAAKDALIRALRRAKADLSERCRAAMGRERYGWPADEPFLVQVGVAADPAADPAAAPWPVVETRPGAVAAAGPLALAPGVALIAAPAPDGGALGAEGGEAIYLRLTRAAVERPAMRELMRFLTEDALGHLFKRPSRRAGGRADRDRAVEPRKPADYLVVAGRGALWPLIWEGLSDLIDETGGLAASRAAALAFAAPEPDSAAAMKSAVVRGAAAALDAAAPTTGARIPDLTHYALLVSERDLEGRERFSQLIPQERFDQMSGYSGYMRLVAAPPRLTAAELNASPWARALIAPTGVAAESRSLRIGPGDPGPSLERGPDGEVSLKIGDAVFPVDGGRFERAPSLHRGLIDVTQAHAPPDWPDSVRFDRSGPTPEETSATSGGGLNRDDGSGPGRGGPSSSADGLEPSGGRASLGSVARRLTAISRKRPA